MAVGKRLRFEIFKRDGFKCVYCGANPVQVALHVDHVEPVVAGGSDDPANLVTACANCNLGKSSVPLDEKRFRPERLTEADTDHAEQIREYLTVQREIAEARRAVVEMLSDYWEERCQRRPEDIETRLSVAVRDFEPGKLMEAIDIVAAKRLNITDSLRYFYGVLRNWREDRDALER